MTDLTPAPTPLDLAALRKIAEGANDGPWEFEDLTSPAIHGYVGPFAVYGIELNDRGEHPGIAGYPDESITREDASHIAAFDPPTVLALIARAEAAEAKIAAVRALHVKEKQWNDREYCAVCFRDEGYDGAMPILYPCPTIDALEVAP